MVVEFEKRAFVTIALDCVNFGYHAQDILELWIPRTSSFGKTAKHNYARLGAMAVALLANDTRQ